MAANKIRLGVVGLGRLWESRHKPALARLKDRFEVTAVYDQVARRAEIEARPLGCRAHDSLSALVAAPEVDAVAWLAPQWFGPHAVELAARAGKPIYCAVPLPEDDAELDRLDEIARSTGSILMPGFAPRHQPATLRLREVLKANPDPIRHLGGAWDVTPFDPKRPADPSLQATPGSILTDPGQACIDLARSFLGAEVATVEINDGPSTFVPGEPDVAQIFARFEASASASFSLSHRARLVDDAQAEFPEPVWEVRLNPAQTFWLTWPNLVRWTDAAHVEHEERLPAGPPIDEVLLDQFFRLVRGLDHSAPGWGDALAAARAVGAIRRSLRDGGSIAVGARPGTGEPR